MSTIFLDAAELKRRADFVAIASRYTRLHRAGSQWRGLCPIHGERNPSLYIEPERKLWKCFGCDRGGDIFDFVMMAEGCDFPRALRIVANSIEGVAGRGEPRSGERLAASEGGAAPSARGAGGKPSQNIRADVLARLDATERRCAGVARTNDAALAELATACEPGGAECRSLVNGGRVIALEHALDCDCPSAFGVREPRSGEPLLETTG